MKAHALHFFSYRRPRSGPEPEGLKGGKKAGEKEIFKNVNYG
jgi:hypothetical protein